MTSVAAPQAVIVDMDGLLLDTERIALRTFKDACAEVGAAADEAVYLECIGTNAAETERILRDGHGPDFPLAEVQPVWDAKFAAMALERPVPLKRGVLSLLDLFERSEIPVAVATSTAHGVASTQLANAGILGRFGFIVAGDQVARGKPDPEIYATAAERFGRKAECCLALEDSDNGVRSAHGAGMNVIQVPDLVPPSQDVLALGHPVMASLEEVKRHLAATWLV